MFERRLKIVLSILLVFVLVLLARAMQLQVIERDYWRQQAADSMRSEKLADSTRGRILDCKGAVLAEDQPCMDACVDYRFIIDPPDPKLLSQTAEKRVKDRLGDEYQHTNTLQKRKLIKDETELLKTQISVMWEKLAMLSGRTRTEIDNQRRSIQDRIEMRRRVIWYRNYKKALADRLPKEDPPWYRKWLIGDSTDVPEIDEISNEPLEEERLPHVILEAIDPILTPDGTPLLNELQKHADEYPGLTLRPSTHRAYPYGSAACHVIGHLGKVWKEDIAADPNLSDELRAYGPNDLKGRDGLESLGEPTLRGVRGITVFDGVTKQTISSSAPRAGEDLRTTIDIDLQMDIQDMFTRVRVPYEMIGKPKDWKCDEVDMHGAAVVIDVTSGEVRALVSNPVYNLNDLDSIYDALLKNNLDTPLMDRATQSMFEPGSTVKPVVGTGAITQGVVGVNEGIECTGFLIINGKRYARGNCWTVATAKSHWPPDGGGMMGHHLFPFAHKGHDGNADGSLSFSDALERSCNIFFENCADRLKIEGLSYWMRQYGLGRPTGIGIAESKGRVPDSYDGPNRQFATWSGGIGQGPVAATPLQMCNIAATIARRGVWERPTLVQPGQVVSAYRPAKVSEGDTSWDDIPSRKDLHIAPAAIDAAWDGMYRVVNGNAGTGTTAFCEEVSVSGKTGTAQAARFMVPKLDESGNPVYGEDSRVVKEPLPASRHLNENGAHRWYRSIDAEGEKLNHAWFIGFVPSEQPKFAISVMVEYGGGGGGAVAGPIAKQIVDALIEHGYLHPTGRANRSVAQRD